MDEYHDRPMYYGLDGHDPVPVSMMEWAIQMEVRHASIELDGTDPWRVARTELPGGGSLSTVFLGLNHNLWPDGPPALFETMLFGTDSWAGEEQWRYATWDAALAGHNELVAQFAAAQ